MNLNLIMLSTVIVVMGTDLLYSYIKKIKRERDDAEEAFKDLLKTYKTFKKEYDQLKLNKHFK